MRINVMRLSWWLFAAAMLGAVSRAGAAPWVVMGPRAMAMGGAGVAIAQGPLASYWNPAGLAQTENTSGLAIPFGAHAEFAGTVLEGAKDTSQLVTDCKAGAADCTQANINSALSELGQPGNGALVDLGAGLELKIKKIVVFYNDLAYIGATPLVDMTHTNPACPGPTCFQNNNSNITLRGANFSEFGAGYGYAIGGTGLMVGGNLKGIIGRVGYSQILLNSTDPGNGSFKKFTDNSAASFRPGIDLGALWDMRETLPFLPMRPRLGIVSRNINNPTFTQPAAAVTNGDTNRFSLQGQARAGAAISPLHFWNVAADIDMTNNVTNVDGFKSRFFGLGTEVNVFNRPWINIPLRAGLQKNIATNSSVAYTFGFGLNFLHVIFDVAGSVSSKTQPLQSQGGSKSVPSNFGAAAQLAFLFGGEDEGARNK